MITDSDYDIRKAENPDAVFLQLKSHKVVDLTYDEALFVWFYCRRALRHTDLSEDLKICTSLTESCSEKLLLEYRPWKAKLYAAINPVGCELNLFWNLDPNVVRKVLPKLQGSLELSYVDWLCLKKKSKAEPHTEKLKSLHAFTNLLEIATNSSLELETAQPNNSSNWMWNLVDKYATKRNSYSAIGLLGTVIVIAFVIWYFSGSKETASTFTEYFEQTPEHPEEPFKTPGLPLNSSILVRLFLAILVLFIVSLLIHWAMSRRNNPDKTKKNNPEKTKKNTPKILHQSHLSFTPIKIASKKSKSKIKRTKL